MTDNARAAVAARWQYSGVGEMGRMAVAVGGVDGDGGGGAAAVAAAAAGGRAAGLPAGMGVDPTWSWL